MNIQKMEVGSAIRDYMMQMALGINLSRAIPFLEDGFKPSQRKMLFTMYKMGLMNKFAKSANIDGQNMKINPHGSSYDTLVRMTREKETLLVPFIHGKGSFGKVYSSKMEEAASRYTESKLAPITKEVFNTLHKHPEIMVDNYDNTLKEPMLLSLPFPNILVNSQQGIGFGFASNFGSFNLVEVCELVKEYITKGTFTEILPDFTTGSNLLYDKEVIDSIFNEGTGTFKFRSDLDVDKENNKITILNAGPDATIERIVDSVQSHYDKGNLPEVTDVIDTVGADGFSGEIYFRKNTDVDDLIRRLYYYTPLEDTFAFNMTLVHEDTIKTMGVKDIIKNWLKHREDYIKVELDYDRKEIEDKLHILHGLELLIDLNKAVEIVRNSKNDAEALANLKAEFGLDDLQAEFVANIKLRNFNKDYFISKTNEIKDLKNKLENLNNTTIQDRIIQELDHIIETYGEDRRTKVIYDWEEIVVKKPKKKKKEIKGKSTIFINNDKIRSAPENSTAKTPDGMTRYDDVDNKGSILAFTNLGNVLRFDVHKIKSSMKDLTSYARKKDLDLGETIIFATPLYPDQDLMILYSNNKINRISMDAWNISSRKIKNGFNIEETPMLFKVIDEDIEFNALGTDINTAQYTAKKSRTSKPINIKRFKKLEA